MFCVELYLGSFTTTFLLGIFTITLLYWFSTRNHDYWKKRGVPYVKPVPLFGNLLEFNRIPTHELDMERFRKLGTVYGQFEGNNPVLSVSDPKLIRDIFVKDFASFPSRRPMESGDKILDNMLTVVKGEDWKRIRSIVTPTFTTGKIKRLLSIFKECSQTLMKNFKTAAEGKKSVDVKRFYTAFTMDVIASSAFSTKLDSHNDPDNEFVKITNAAFAPSTFRFLLFLFAPRLLRFLQKGGILVDFLGFFKGVVDQIISERKKTGQVRNDFLQLLLDTNKEEVDGEIQSKEKEEDLISNYIEESVGKQIYKNVIAKNLSLDELVAQCIIFFIAGSETTASTLSFATYLLAIHPEVRDRLREEVDSALEKTDGELTYEAIQSMKYLDNVISETLRLYPPIVRLERRADVDYQLGNTGITIQKGMLVSIPAYVLHRDPSLFSNPDKFNPERFNPEQRQSRDSYSYVPFGSGPRNCVAMRFALMEMKVCLAHVVANFEINKCSQTKIPLEFKFIQSFLMPKNILVDMQIRRDCKLKI